MSEKSGIIRIPSSHSVDETVERIKAILQSRGVTIFSVIDHSGEAAKTGMQMPNTKLLVFGSPKAGTPVMLAAPSIALDLPLKILVAEDGAGSDETALGFGELAGEGCCLTGRSHANGNERCEKVGGDGEARALGDVVYVAYDLEAKAVALCELAEEIGERLIGAFESGGDDAGGDNGGF